MTKSIWPDIFSVFSLINKVITHGILASDGMGTRIADTRSRRADRRNPSLSTWPGRVARIWSILPHQSTTVHCSACLDAVRGSWQLYLDCKRLCALVKICLTEVNRVVVWTLWIISASLCSFYWEKCSPHRIAMIGNFSETHLFPNRQCANSEQEFFALHSLNNTYE